MHKKYFLVLALAAASCTSMLGQLSHTISAPQCLPRLLPAPALSLEETVTPFQLQEWVLRQSQLAYLRGQIDAQAILARFLEQYPTDARRSQASLQRGARYLAEGDFQRARYHLERVDELALTGDALAEWQVRLAYALMKTNRGEENLSQLFMRAMRQPSYWGHVAALYVASEELAAGHVAQAKSRYERLLSYTGSPADYQQPEGEAIATEAYIGLAAVSYYEGHPEQAISMAERLMHSDARLAAHPTLLQIAGNAHYRQGNPTQAVLYLRRLWQDSPETMQPEDRLVLGAALMEGRAYDEAQAVLLPATEGRGLTAEVASLYVARARRELSDNTGAIASYEKAAQAHAHPAVRESALYEMAVLLHATRHSNFGQDVRIVETFIKDFPQSKHRPTVEAMLQEFYLTNTHYPTSWASLQRMEPLSTELRRARQYVLNHMALLAVEQHNFSEAEQWLKKALEKPSPDNLYLGESYLIYSDLLAAKGDSHGAIGMLERYLSMRDKQATPNRAEALYRKGYLHFNLKAFSQAQKAFSEYLSFGNISEDRLSDATSRLADCYYALGRTNEAARYYEQAYQRSSRHGAYALFRRAELAGLFKDYSKQIALLGRLMQDYPESPYRRRAYLERGRAALLNNRPSEAQKHFAETAKLFPQSGEGRQALLQLALLHYNQGRIELAAETYRNLISLAPSSQEAASAFSSIKSLAIETGRPELAREAAVVSGGALSLNADEERLLDFEGIEQRALRNDARAERDLTSFIAKYPHGLESLKAQVYLAEIALQKGEKERARALYAQIAEQAEQLEPALQETVLLSLARLESKEAHHSEALALYVRVYHLSTTMDTRLEAAQRGAEAALLARQYTTGISLAQKALEDLAGAGTAPIRLALAHLYRADGKRQQAVAEYLQLSKESDTPWGAEAVVAHAELLSEQKGQRAEAKKRLTKFIEQGSGQEYFLARAFLLLADIYHQEGNDATARQYLESLEANYPHKEDDIASRIEAQKKQLDSRQD